MIPPPSPPSLPGKEKNGGKVSSVCLVICFILTWLWRVSPFAMFLSPLHWGLVNPENPPCIYGNCGMILYNIGQPFLLPFQNYLGQLFVHLCFGVVLSVHYMDSPGDGGVQQSLNLGEFVRGILSSDQLVVLWPPSPLIICAPLWERFSGFRENRLSSSIGCWSSRKAPPKVTRFNWQMKP